MLSAKIMEGRTCLITGANSGIGKAITVELARLGASVVMLCRDLEKGKKALFEVKAQTLNPNISLLIADLTSQKSIHKAVNEFKSEYNQLHVLMNNAGVLMTSRQENEENIEITFAINYLSHFLLTNLLLDVLKSSAPARIINISSHAHLKANLNFNDLQNTVNYNGFKAYSQSKLANILFTYEFARRYDGMGITANTLHPGTVRTNIGKNSSPVTRLLLNLSGIFSVSPRKGAITPVYLATSSAMEHISGKYFYKNKIKQSSTVSYDKIVQKQLWEESEKLTNLA